MEGGTLWRGPGRGEWPGQVSSEQCDQASAWSEDFRGNRAVAVKPCREAYAGNFLVDKYIQQNTLNYQFHALYLDVHLSNSYLNYKRCVIRMVISVHDGLVVTK